MEESFKKVVTSTVFIVTHLILTVFSCVLQAIQEKLKLYERNKVN